MRKRKAEAAPQGFVRVLYRFVRPVRSWFALSFVCVLVSSACNLSQALVIRDLIDGAIRGKGSDLLALVACLCVVTLVWLAAKFAFVYSGGVFGSRVIRDMNAALASRVCTMRADVMETLRSGDILSRFANDLKSLSAFIGNRFNSLFYSAVLFFAGLAWMIAMDWRLALACQVLTPLAMIAIFITAREIPTIIASLLGCWFAIRGEISVGGKTTIMNLICAYREPSAGKVRLYGRALSEWSLEVARGKMAVVSRREAGVRRPLAFGRAGEHRRHRRTERRRKSTLLKLLPRFYEAGAGELRVDGRPGSRIHPRLGCPMPKRPAPSPLSANS